MNASPEFLTRLRKMRHYAKQYWKVKQQEQLLAAEISYEAATSFCSDCPGRDGNCCKEQDMFEEHWSDTEFARFKRLMRFCERYSTPEMIELTRPVNYGGVLDICELRWPDEEWWKDGG